MSTASLFVTSFYIRMFECSLAVDFYTKNLNRIALPVYYIYRFIHIQNSTAYIGLEWKIDGTLVEWNIQRRQISRFYFFRFFFCCFSLLLLLLLLFSFLFKRCCWRCDDDFHVHNINIKCIRMCINIMC